VKKLSLLEMLLVVVKSCEIDDASCREGGPK
jgi:hypothetical protein